MSHPFDDDEFEDETLEESVIDSMGTALARMMTNNQADLDTVQRSVKDWNRLTHADLARLHAIGKHNKALDFALKYPRDLNEASGVLTWDPNLVKQDIEAAKRGDEAIRPVGAPRFFLSYRWTDLQEEQMLIDSFAGDLFNSGYDIVFDRDPRHVDKGLSAGDLLWLLPSCTHFLVLITDGYTDRILNKRHMPSAVSQEFSWAAQLSRRYKRPQFMGIWISGKQVPPPFKPQDVLDFRDTHEAARIKFQVFPNCKFMVLGKRTDDTGRMIGPIERRDVRRAIAELEAAGGFLSITVQDVTAQFRQQ